MSEENVEIVRRGFDAWDEGDLAANLQLVHEDVVCSRMAPLLDPQTYHGREGYVEFASEWIGPYDDFKLLPSEYIDAGDRVLVEVAQEGRLAGSNQVMKGTFWFLMTVRDGQMTRFEIYGGRDQALEAAGLSDS
jgi:ketosteroid isomerase-like protein